MFNDYKRWYKGRKIQSKQFASFQLLFREHFKSMLRLQQSARIALIKRLFNQCQPLLFPGQCSTVSRVKFTLYCCKPLSLETCHVSETHETKPSHERREFNIER